ncbi:hypothetical protein B0I35DRAFT_472982 [Stachybotrys elegans]|uniref:Uncharacterized protein n=1 Tax=Stachybotrys elegans TaxID=80388 RepID=A0A8K0WWJ7_9HYPO|nr:hypothetical protein B0I35DRAFT_472982 [Stachybotrys elegans]
MSGLELRMLDVEKRGEKTPTSRPKDGLGAMCHTAANPAPFTVYPAGDGIMPDVVFSSKSCATFHGHGGRYATPDWSLQEHLVETVVLYESGVLARQECRTLQDGLNKGTHMAVQTTSPGFIGRMLRHTSGRQQAMCNTLFVTRKTQALVACCKDCVLENVAIHSSFYRGLILMVSTVISTVVGILAEAYWKRVRIIPIAES